jgi:hypothetical protein
MGELPYRSYYLWLGQALWGVTGAHRFEISGAAGWHFGLALAAMIGMSPVGPR